MEVTTDLADRISRVVSESENGQIASDRPEFDYRVVFYVGSFLVAVLPGGEIE